MLLYHTSAKDSITLENTFLIPLAMFHPSMVLLCGAIPNSVKESQLHTNKCSDA